jgi:hypothetical protein
VSVRSRRAAGAANTGGALVAWIHRVVIFVGGGDASVCNICLSSIDLKMNGAIWKMSVYESVSDWEREE